MLPLLVMQPPNGAAAAAGKKGASDAAGGGGGAAVELPLHLTEKILCHMSLLESARLATVCKAWAGTVAALLAAPAPHLYVCMPPHNRSDHRGLVASVALDGDAGGARPLPPAAIPARVRSSETNGLRCVGATPSGRVAFAAGWFSEDVVLVNPVTGARRSIRVGTSRLDHSRVLVAGAGGDDALFAVDGCTRMLWRRQAPGGCGGEDEWSRCAVEPTLQPQLPLSSPVFAAVNCNGRFYLLHDDGSLSTIDAAAPPPLRMEKLPAARVTAAPHVSGHLLESDGEVLFVQQQLASGHEDHESLSVGGFQVSRFDAKENRWTDVDELAGDRALFVSPGSSFAVRASATPGCRRNCIYFVGKKWYYSSPSCHENCGSTWGVYSMEERRVLFEHDVTGPGPATEAMWFLPRVV